MQAKAVNSAPNHDVIQVSAQEMKNAKNELTSNPEEFESWDIHNVRTSNCDSFINIYLVHDLIDHK